MERIRNNDCKTGNIRAMGIDPILPLQSDAQPYRGGTLAQAEQSGKIETKNHCCRPCHGHRSMGKISFWMCRTARQIQLFLGRTYWMNQAMRC